uniref:Tenascin XB n=1 Tax=Periophthalmus magnuspinnatus TaxID=409849 RepID=A0A3B3Z630_9GOBI
GIPSMSHREEALGKTQGTLESLCLSTGLGMPCGPTGGAGGSKGMPSGPSDLRVVKTSTSSAVVQWEPSQSDIDRYRLTVSRGDGVGRSQELTFEPGTSSAHITQLEPGLRYDITLVAEKGRSQSEPVTTHATPGSDGAGDLRATNVKPRTTTLSWKPPSRPVIGYKLTYQTEGQKKVGINGFINDYYLCKFGCFVLSGSLRFPFPSDCSQEQLNGLSVSGLVDIFPLGRQGAALSVWCDMETDGGGWTVFQRRKDGSVDFFRSWKEYVQGFGDPSGEFWLGLDALHTLTTSGRMTLRVDLRDGHDFVFAQYSMFEVAKKNYRLTVAGYSGTAGDSMSYHNNRIFSTKDRDPVSFITRCAMSYRGGWWYKNCHEANLNGLYGINSKHQGIIWTSWKGKEASIPFTEMKMRPTDFIPNKNNYRY